MSLPLSVSNSNFQLHNNAIHDATTKAVKANMEEAAKELLNLDEDAIRGITVSFDGT